MGTNKNPVTKKQAMNNANRKLIFLSVPGLRESDLAKMPQLTQLIQGGSRSRLAHSFPCVTWPSQANMLTGKLPDQHGVIANGFYWRDSGKVEMWTAWNDVIQQPQIWDVLKQQGKSSAAWFPMLSKGCGADYVCMPAPIHQPDGSEDLWCYTKPQVFYGELLEELGHFPLQHFWGPLANIRSSAWIVESAVAAAKNFHPDFFYIYLPHLDYAAQKDGPDSDSAQTALQELDEWVGKLADQMHTAYASDLTWIIASEYTIIPVNHVTYPNRMLREAGLLVTRSVDQREWLDFENSAAWSLVDHQFSHVFVKNHHPDIVEKVKSIFQDADGISQVLSGSDRQNLAMLHERSGDLILVSSPNSWQAYYWWLDDSNAPPFASTVDIHQKPGYDPVELHFDFANKCVPLDATLIKGSHGAPATRDDQKGVLLCSDQLSGSEEIKDTAVFDIVLDLFR